MRGVAIAMVLFWHLIVSAIAVRGGTAVAYVLAATHLTRTGVDLFLVLSGFLITLLPVASAAASPTGVRAFLVRRLARVVPLYLVCLALFASGLWLAATQQSEPLRKLFNTSLPVWSYLAFLQNMMAALNGTLGAKWMEVTWSLALEMQFYLLFPLLARNVTLRTLRGVAVTAIIVAPIVRLGFSAAGTDWVAPYVLLPARIDALAWGVFLGTMARDPRTWDWLLAHRVQMRWATVVLGLGAVVLTAKENALLAESIEYSWVAALYGCMVALAVTSSGSVLSRILTWSPLVGLGTISYAVYLLHQGLNGFFHYAILNRVPLLDSWQSLLVTLAGLTATVLLSVLSWRHLEKPIMRYAHARFPYVRRGPAVPRVAAHAAGTK